MARGLSGRPQRRVYVEGRSITDATLHAVIEQIIEELFRDPPRTGQPALRAPTITSFPSGSRTRATRSPHG